MRPSGWRRSPSPLLRSLSRLRTDPGRRSFVPLIEIAARNSPSDRARDDEPPSRYEAFDNDRPIPATPQPEARRAPAHSGTSIAAKNAGITRSSPYRAGSTMNPPRKKPLPADAGQPAMITVTAPK